jgi:catechol 2,3-dioxygenase-like lactoylglutathione lyase family enzyme
MSITLDHMVLPVADGEISANHFAEVMGLVVGEREGIDRKFVSVRVNEILTLLFLTSDKRTPQHMAFLVDDATLDGVISRLERMAWPYGNSPRQPDNRRTDHPFAPRGLFWTDPSGHLYELMASA